jgi:hypothetical protein
LHHTKTLAAGAEEKHLGLEKTAFEEDEGLVLEFVNHLAEGEAFVVLMFSRVTRRASKSGGRGALTYILVSVIAAVAEHDNKTLLKFLPPRYADQQRVRRYARFNESEPRTFKISTSSKFLCWNHAFVTIPSFSRTCPKACGLSAITTTAFCTVLLVTSLGLSWSFADSSCRVQDMPKSEEALGWLGGSAFCRRVK